MALPDLEPISIHWRPQLPDPAKVLIVLEELHLPYSGIFIPHSELSTPKYESANPTNKVPAIHDPNTKVILAESSAIIRYLIDMYDEHCSLTYTTIPEKYHLLQWFHFQSSNFTPAIEALAHHAYFHPQPTSASAQQHYTSEVRRVVSILDKQLEGRKWLVGDKCTYADLSYVAWNATIDKLMEGRKLEEWDPEWQFPNFWRWQMGMLRRGSVRKAMSVGRVEDVKS